MTDEVFFPEIDPRGGLRAALGVLLADYWKRDELADDLLATLDKLGWQLTRKP